MKDNILLDERVMWFKKKVQAVPGKLKISVKRISFEKEIVAPTPYGGGITRLLAKLKEWYDGDPLILDQPISEVIFRKGKKIGKKTFLLEVETSDQNVFKFMIDPELLSKIEGIIKLRIKP